MDVAVPVVSSLDGFASKILAWLPKVETTAGPHELCLRIQTIAHKKLSVWTESIQLDAIFLMENENTVLQTAKSYPQK